MTKIHSVIFVLALLTASATRAEVIILQNDSFDGGAVTCNQNVIADRILAAKFTAPPTAYPYTVAKINVLTCQPMTGLQGTFYVEIWQDTGGVIPGPHLWSSSNGYTIGGANIGFGVIDLSGEPIPPPPITAGTIRVGLFALFTSGVGFGLDLNGIIPQTNLIGLENGSWSYIENPPVNGTGDWIFRLEVQTSPTAVGDRGASGFVLEQNVPNPFNPVTTIRYEVPVDGTEVSISVFDAVGRRVRTLVDERRPAGLGSVTWNGVDERGASVASGVYFYRMRAGSYDQTRKMVMLK
jgi:FlgD Ig-like domain